MEPCFYCGEPAMLEVSEIIFETRELVLDACCEENLHEWLAVIPSWTRKERARWMLLETGVRIRDLIVSEETISWNLDYGVRLGEVAFPTAAQFIDEHHRDLDAPVGWMFGKAAFNGSEMVGVMTAGRPVSPALAAQGCLEINRVCVKESCPRALSKDACSLLYGYACREGFRRGYHRIVTYTGKHESGSSLRAAGFVPVAITAGGSWNRTSRPRKDKSSTRPKIRWERWSDAATLPKQLCLSLAA